jgi:N6-adenosine-specific RNA methylase IME4
MKLQDEYQLTAGMELPYANDTPDEAAARIEREREVQFRGRITALRARIGRERDASKLVALIAEADTIEEAMANAGYRSETEVLRPANETRFLARWKLGRLLAKVERQKVGGGRGGKLTVSRIGTSYRAYLQDIGLNKSRAHECERIGAIPDQKLPNAFAEAAKEGVLNTIDSMFRFARPFWKIEIRHKKHKKIRDEAEMKAAAAEAKGNAPFGPFPIIYADPPTHFETYTEGSYRGPNQHYPTLSWEEIENFTIDGKRISEIAHDDAMLFLWCTSSNIPYALRIMEAWGFQFKASAVWDKGVMGTGLIFRNMHELLFYGSRGDAPGPVYVPQSVFRFPRGEHSAKPPEIRLDIERMYPNYDASTRLELFSRDSAPGWTHFGLEANKTKAT